MRGTNWNSSDNHSANQTMHRVTCGRCYKEHDPRFVMCQEVEGMKREDVVAVKQLIGSTQWAMNYLEFLRRASFSDDNYAENKWHEFQKLAKAMAQFDDNTFCQILGVME